MKDSFQDPFPFQEQLAAAADGYLVEVRDAALEEAAVMLKESYPDNANTNAFCAAIRSLKSTAEHKSRNR